MITLEKSKKYPQVFIKGELPSNIINVLMQELSYWIEGIEHSKKFKENKTDGYCYLLRKSKKGEYYFPVGLINRVKGVLDAYGIEYEVVEPEHSISNLNLLWNSEYKLRDYQQDAVMKAIENKQGLISLPTGSGKTLVALAIMYALDCSTLIIVHKTELANQWIKNIREALGYDAGFVGGGEEKWRDITIGMMQTLRNKDIPEFKLLCFDEVHHLPSQTMYGIAMKSNAPYRIGISATPWRQENDELKIFAGVGEVIINITAEDLIDMGYLAKPKFVFLDPPPVSGGARNWQQEYKKGIVQNEGRNQMIVAMVNKLLDQGMSVYVHVERINHGEILSNRLNAPFISGRDSGNKRSRTLKEFENGEIKVLVSTLLGEGIDIPEISAIIICSGQKTSIGIIQKIGRALRVTDDKHSAVVVDFADKGKYLSNHFEQRYYAMKKYYGRYFKVGEV